MADVDKYKSWLTFADYRHDKLVKDQLKKRREYYRGNQWKVGDSASYRNKSIDNIIFSNITTIIPSIFFQNPKITVKSKTPPRKNEKGLMYNPVAGSATLEVLLNYYLRELEFVWQVKRCAYDAELGPWGVMQIGYTVETEVYQQDKRTEPNELIKSESPFMVRRSPEDLRVDPECTDHLLTSANFIALRWVKRLEDVKKDPRFKGSGVKDLRANYTVKNSGDDSVTRESIADDEDWGRLEGWDIWDKRNQKIITVVKEHDKVLCERPWPLIYEGFPVQTLYYYENPDELYPISPTDMDIPIQDEINRISSLQLEQIKAAASTKMICQRNSLDPEEMDKLENGPANVVAWCNGSPKDVIEQVRAPNVSQDIWLVRRQLKDDNRVVRGIADFEQGNANFNSATEADLTAQAVGVRKSERRASLEHFLKRCVRTLAQVSQQSLSRQDIHLNEEQYADISRRAPDRLADIVGEDGAKALLPWMSVEREDIEGEYDVDIEVGSTQPMSDQLRRNDAVGLYNLLKDNPYVSASEPTKNLIESFDKKPDKFMRDPAQVEQQMAQSAQAQSQAELAPLQMKQQTDMQKTQMKTQAAMQQAQLSSQTVIAQAEIGAKVALERELNKTHETLSQRMIDHANS